MYNKENCRMVGVPNTPIDLIAKVKIYAVALGIPLQQAYVNLMKKGLVAEAGNISTIADEVDIYVIPRRELSKVRESEKLES